MWEIEITFKNKMVIKTYNKSDEKDAEVIISEILLKPDNHFSIASISKDCKSDFAYSCREILFVRAKHLN